MSNSSVRAIIAGILYCCLVYTPATIAADFNNFSSNVFKFQKKLAEKGDVSAQFKLGKMYERGRGTDKDIGEAMRWYKMASAQGSVSADDRVMYHDIKSQGYDKNKHGDWVDGIVKKSGSGDMDAKLLLSEMHRAGLGVKQDDKKALDLLQQLRMAGNSEVDNQIAVLETKRATARAEKAKAAKVVLKKKASKKAKSKAKADKKAKQMIAKSKASSKKASVRSNSGTGDAAMAKKLRYEAVMRKLAEEQLMLQQQQQWAEED